MTRIIRIVAASLAALAIAAPAATAMPQRDHVGTSGPTMAPADAKTSVEGGDGSPLAYIIPGLAACVLLAGGVAYAVRSSGRARRPQIGA